MDWENITSLQKSVSELSDLLKEISNALDEQQSEISSLTDSFKLLETDHVTTKKLVLDLGNQFH